MHPIPQLQNYFWKQLYPFCGLFGQEQKSWKITLRFAKQLHRTFKLNWLQRKKGELVLETCLADFWERLLNIKMVTKSTLFYIEPQQQIFKRMPWTSQETSSNNSFLSKLLGFSSLGNHPKTHGMDVFIVS